MTTAVALSPPLPAHGRESSRSSTLPAIISHGLVVALESPWSIYCVENGGDALKTGRVTVPLYNIVEMVPVQLKMNHSLFLGVIHFQQSLGERLRAIYIFNHEKLDKTVPFSTILSTCPLHSMCVCFLPIHSGHQVRWTYQPGSHRISIHLLSAVRALIFLARRIQRFL